MKILVTGAGGFLGKEICRQLSELKLGVIFGVGRNHYPELEDLPLKQFILDIRDSKDVNRFFEDHQFDALIHTAAKAGIWGEFQDFFSINTEGTRNLLNAALNSGVRHFIYTSTPSVVFGKKSISNGNETLDYPKSFLTHYAYTKSLAEREVLSIPKQKLQTVAIRPHLIYGQGDPHILPRLIEKNRQGRLRIIGEGKNLVDVTHVSRAAEAHVKALQAMMKNPDLSNEAYFIGDEKPVVLWDFINKLLEDAGEKPVRKKINQTLCYWLGAVMEVIYRFLPKKFEPPMTRFVCLQLSTDHYFSHQKAVKQLNL